jgi:hypothetical protein
MEQDVIEGGMLCRIDGAVADGIENSVAALP